MTKEFYKTRLSDLIPIVGVIKYNERCAKEWDDNSALHQNDDYEMKCFARNLGLGMYNFTIIAGAAGLLKLLN